MKARPLLRCLVVLVIGLCFRAMAAEGERVLVQEFIFEKAPFRSCHASTIAESGEMLVAAWFGGTAEKNRDVGIWFSRAKRPRGGEAANWTAPVEVANGVQEEGKERVPCWNPVLFQARKGALLLFYKAGPSPSKWWGMVMKSDDAGKTWSKPERLPDDLLGPIKDKPIQLPDGRLLCPSSTEDQGWRLRMEFCSPDAAEWSATPFLNTGRDFAAIQPTILRHSTNRLQLLCRTQQKRIAESWSEDGGKTWTPLKATELLNPNSGIDATTTRDGRHFLVFNPTERNRTPLELDVSRNGRQWERFVTLEEERGEFSYPAVIQTSDGLLHITYTWKRERIRHVVIDPEK